MSLKVVLQVKSYVLSFWHLQGGSFAAQERLNMETAGIGGGADME